MGAAFARLDESLLEQLKVDGAGRWRRAGAVLAMTRGGVAGAFAAVVLLVLGSAVPLHLAQVETYAFEIWKLADQLPWGQRGRVWVAAWPLIALAVGVG